MLRVHDLSAHVLRNPYKGPCVFTTRYAELVRIYFQSPTCLTIHLGPLLEAFRESFPRFTKGEPHDAQDVIFCLVDILERTYPEQVKRLVYGETEQRTLWPSGAKTSREPFSVFILPGGGTVSALVAEAEQWHTLTDYVDDGGTTHHVATTRTSIITYPPVLFVSFHTKARVTVDDALFGGRYEVCGSVIHVGGHYISMVRLGNQWFVQDDETIRGPVDFPEQGGHHVLMYTLKNPPS